MDTVSRRQILETAGAGAVVGAGTLGVSGQQRTVASAATGSFTATGTGGFLTINADNPSPGENEDGTRFPLAGDGVDGEFIIEGEIASDGTWESTSTTMPSFTQTESTFLGDITIDVTYYIEGIITGTIDRAGNLLTSQMPLRVDIVVSGAANSSGTVEADANNLTTETSGAMTGSASGLDTTSGTASLVDNELTLPSSGADLVDSVFALPSQTVGRNWMRLDLNLSLPALTGTVAGTVTDGTDPLSGVVVDILDAGDGTLVQTVTTDSTGAYTATLDPATYEVEITEDGYAPSQAEVTVTEGVTSTLDIALDELPTFAEGPPADNDGDGLYEDVRGNGDLSILDVQELFKNLDNPDLQANSELFNFQGDSPDEVGILDVQALYDQYL